MSDYTETEFRILSYAQGQSAIPILRRGEVAQRLYDRALAYPQGSPRRRILRTGAMSLLYGSSPRRARLAVQKLFARQE